MEWTDPELDELATFFAKRMTPSLELVDATDPPPPGDPATPWREKLRTARARGTLAPLARKIAAADPSDRNLQQACDLLQGPGGRNVVQVMGAALSVGALLLGAGVIGIAGVVWLAAGPRIEPLQPQADLVAAAEHATAEPTPIPDPDLGRIGLDEPEPEELESEEPESELAVLERAAEPPLAAPAGTPELRPNARCTGTPGEVVGYWYAGDKKPGRQGGRVLLEKTVNVRTDYPDVHNAFNARSTVRCVLVQGDRIRLEQAPIKVPGNAWWVPLVAGSVEVPKS